MAQKRIQYVKTATGVEKQLIASSADIVEIEKVSGLNATNVQDALEELSNIAANGGVTSVNGKSGAVTLVKGDIDLGNVTNDAQVKRSEMGVASGVATLDTTGKVPTSQLPAYVDDVLEYANKAAFPTTGETGKIYVAQDTNITYRWGGTAYVEISASLALGETSSTAFAGDKGRKNAQDIDTLKQDVAGIQRTTPDKLAYTSVVDLTPADSNTVDPSVQIKNSGIELIGYNEFSYESDEVGETIVRSPAGITIPIVPGDNVIFTKDGTNNTVKINSTLANTGVTAGTYSAVSVDVKGRVTAGSQIIEWGTDGQTTPSANLAVGGLFFELVE